MPVFVYIGHDGPRGAELRKTVRDRHLGHIEALDREQRIHFAGPLRDDAGAPCGSVIVMEAESLAAARAIRACSAMSADSTPRSALSSSRVSRPPVSSMLWTPARSSAAMPRAHVAPVRSSRLIGSRASSSSGAWCSALREAMTT